ncbi:helix-turn-helix domain-containing protein [Blastomonas fulva]|uniref:helix-turn-helix domain-containing protein n=1 Tax=Blastomonas fulva TaxID=1550728 RepID=UPI003D276E7D
MDADEARVGQRLQDLRKMHRLSQRELARRAGLTHGTISFIERDKISPSIGTMRQILECLGLTLSDFFGRDGDTSPRYFFERKDLFEVGTGGVSLLQVGKSLAGRPLQVLLETYPPGSETARLPYRVEGGEEGGVIIEGEIEATIGDEIRILRQYDAYLFPTSLPHKLRNISDRACVIVSATTPPV